MYYWSFLALAIVSEVIGTMAMKYSEIGFPKVGLAIMYFMLVVSFSSLMVAVKRIPLAVAYGAWESLGLVLISFFCYVLFDEPLSPMKILGIVTILTGMFLLEHGTDHSEHSTEVKS